VSLRVGRCHKGAFVFACIFMRVHVCVYIYICAFFCSECCVHFVTGALGTSAWADVYVTQVFLTTTYISANTLFAGCAHMCICMYMCVCMHMYMDTYMRL